MKLKFLPFYEESGRQNTDPTQTAKIHAAALAFAIANMVHIPTSMVENPASHFNLQLLPGINQTVSEWNEEIVFDARECIEQARAFWLIRYTAAHPNSRVIYSFDHSFFETMIGVNMFVSSDFAKFLDTYKAPVLSLAVLATTIIGIKAE
ncbi:MAG: hypothetical protein ACD_84C00012G0003 [uncultured bacterium]|nr:MAG: hypothetical protein ACD_84C00012G0003 [uncultured bacterium]